MFRMLVYLHFLIFMLFLGIFGGILYGKVLIMDEEDFVLMLIPMLVIEVFLSYQFCM